MVLLSIVLCSLYIINFYFFNHFKFSSSESILQRLLFSYRLIGFFIFGIILILLCYPLNFVKYFIYAVYGFLLVSSLCYSIFIKLIVGIIHMIDKKTAAADRGTKLTFVNSAIYLLILLITYYLFG
ncbi:MAG: hypothetical protein R3Y21_04570 [Mycoplasmatota bacterium]